MSSFSASIRTLAAVTFALLVVCPALASDATESVPSSSNAGPILVTPDFDPDMQVCLPELGVPLPVSAEDFESSDTLNIDYGDTEIAQYISDLANAVTGSRPEKQMVDALVSGDNKLLRANVQCAICLSCINADTLATPKCGHFLHKNCLAQIKDGRCGTCREKGPHNDVLRKTEVTKILRLFEDKNVIPPPTAEDLAEPTIPMRNTDATGDEIADYIQARVRKNARLFYNCLYEVAHNLRLGARHTWVRLFFQVYGWAIGLVTKEEFRKTSWYLDYKPDFMRYPGNRTTYFGDLRAAAVLLVDNVALPKLLPSTDNENFGLVMEWLDEFIYIFDTRMMPNFDRMRESPVESWEQVTNIFHQIWNYDCVPLRPTNNFVVEKSGWRKKYERHAQLIGDMFNAYRWNTLPVFADLYIGQTSRSLEFREAEGVVS